MNLQAFYELKERLEYAAIAGVRLLGEDFRLKRAVDAMAPLAAASPVFAKITAGVEKLLAAPEHQRGGELLDVLSLVHAVAYTQGSVGVPGDLSPLPGWEGTYVPIPYSHLSQLLGAMCSKGSGRTNTIEPQWKEHPEYFADFRVLPTLIKGLGDGYAALAELYFTILSQQGPKIIPLLKEDFDPKGKKEMARRVQLIVSLGGPEENEWLLSILPETKRDVRETVILALAGCQENLQILLDLTKTEKGKHKEAALRALASMESDEALTVWSKALDDNCHLADGLGGATSMTASKALAYALSNVLAPYVADVNTLMTDQEEAKLQALLPALPGKWGPEIEDIYRSMAAFDRQLDKKKYHTWAKQVMSLRLYVTGHQSMPFSCVVAALLCRSVLCNPCPSILALAREIGEDRPQLFLSAAVVADLVTLSKEKVYEKYAPRIPRGSATTQDQNIRRQITMGLSHVVYRKDISGYAACIEEKNPCTGLMQEVVIPIDGMDSRWYTLLTARDVAKEKTFPNPYTIYIPSGDVSLDNMLCSQIDPANPESGAVLAQYFHARALEEGAAPQYAPFLLACGWTDWRGFFPQCAEKAMRLDIWDVEHYYKMISLPLLEQAEECRQLDEIATRRKLVSGYWSSDRMKYWINQLEGQHRQMLTEAEHQTKEEH